jgi:isocitrate dehydrogenase kinase/phosphatase
MSRPEALRTAALVIRDCFDDYHFSFKALTRHAGKVFALRDWTAIPDLTKGRQSLYLSSVRGTAERVTAILGDAIHDHDTWVVLKSEFGASIEGRRDAPIVQSFFNSVLRKMFRTEGIDPDTGFMDLQRRLMIIGDPPEPVYDRFYLGRDDLEILWARILRSYSFSFRFQDFDRDVERISQAIRAHVVEKFGRQEEVDQLDMVRSVFYRNKGAYLVGKISKGNVHIPVVLPLLHHEDGVAVDGVLLSKDEIAVIFSFSRSYFFVESESPVDLIHFLRPLMSHKNLSELYASIGYDRHSKTVLFKEIHQHLERSDDQFVVAPGTKGMVMAVFTLPNFPIVFKVIRDRFGPTKNFDRQHVIDSYRLVLLHDRVGRLADAMEYDHLKFDLSRFSQPVLDELLNECGRTVFIDGDQLVIRHLFTEKKLVPLNLFIETASPERAAEVIIDYGYAVKELAAANIFPGDLLLKNFGVTRHGRVVFYDYDELCFLDQINFRRIPTPRRQEQLYSGEVWYTVEENDVFPQEFDAFMAPLGELRRVFMEHHSDLFDTAFWKDMQKVHQEGRLADFFPYRRNKVRLGYSIE